MNFNLSEVVWHRFKLVQLFMHPLVFENVCSDTQKCSKHFYNWYEHSYQISPKRKRHSFCDFEFGFFEMFERKSDLKCHDLSVFCGSYGRIWSFFCEINLNSHLYVIPIIMCITRRIISILTIIIISFSSTTTANNTYDNNANYGHIEDNDCEKTNCSTILLIGIICVRICCIIKIWIHFLTNKLYIKIWNMKWNITERFTKE